MCGADLDTLQSLVEKSLVRFTSERYWMLETIREYAAELLKYSGATEDIRRRHRAHYVALAADNARSLFGGEEHATLARLAPDFENLRQAISDALAAGEPDDVGRIVGSLFPLLITRGHQAEARDWVEAALADREQLSSKGLLETLLGGGEIIRFSGDLTRARELKEEELLLLRRDPDNAGWIPSVLADLCDIALDEGEFERAREYANESAATGGGARAAASLAELALRVGDLDSAESHGLSALEGTEDGEYNHACMLELLGETSRRRGDGAAAILRFRDGVRAFAQLGDGAGVGDCLDGLSRLAAGAGDEERAGRLRGAAQNLRKEWGRGPTRFSVEPVAASDSAISHGALMSIEEAVAYALAATADSSPWPG